MNLTDRLSSTHYSPAETRVEAAPLDSASKADLLTPRTSAATTDMRSSSGTNRVRSLAVGLLGAIVGLGTGAALTKLMWSGLARHFGNGVELQGSASGSGSGTGSAEGNVEGELDAVGVGPFNIPVDGAASGEGSGTIDGAVEVDTMDAEFSADTELDIGAAPVELYLAVMSIFAAVISFAFFTVERLFHLSEKQNDMRAEAQDMHNHLSEQNERILEKLG